MFQLFWSWNALSSPLVREEWRQALALNRPHFVRPVYWEEPLPERAGLPPVELKRLHFQRVYPRIPSPPLSSPLPSPVGASLPKPSRPSASGLIRYGSAAAVLVAAVGLFWTVRSGPPAADPPWLRCRPDRHPPRRRPPIAAAPPSAAARSESFTSTGRTASTRRSNRRRRQPLRPRDEVRLRRRREPIHLRRRSRR